MDDVLDVIFELRRWFHSKYIGTIISIPEYNITPTPLTISGVYRPGITVISKYNAIIIPARMAVINNRVVKIVLLKIYDGEKIIIEKYWYYSDIGTVKTEISAIMDHFAIKN